MSKIQALSPPPPESTRTLVGALLAGQYYIVKPLGEGSMGKVFEAVQRHLNRPVAVKVLACNLCGDDTAMQRFCIEANAIASLSHPHVVQVIDFHFHVHDRPFLVMELLRGETLEARRTRQERLGLDDVATIVRQVASGLGAAHQAGIIHRDLKPENIFLTESSQDDGFFVKLLDFGISRVQTRSGPRLTRADELLGTPEYMAPEQALGAANVDERADQHALAVVAYELLTGTHPFESDKIVDCLQKVVYEQPARADQIAPDVPEAAALAMERAMSKDPAERFATIGEFATALANALTYEVERTSLGDARLDALDCLRRARIAYEQGSSQSAALIAASIFDLYEERRSEALGEAIRLGGSLMEAIFRDVMGPVDREITYLAPICIDMALSEREAFILERTEATMTIQDAIDAAGLPTACVLYLLFRLERRKLLGLAPRPDASAGGRHASRAARSSAPSSRAPSARPPSARPSGFARRETTETAPTLLAIDTLVSAR